MKTLKFVLIFLSWIVFFSCNKIELKEVVEYHDNNQKKVKAIKHYQKLTDANGVEKYIKGGIWEYYGKTGWLSQKVYFDEANQMKIESFFVDGGLREIQNFKIENSDTVRITDTRQLEKIGVWKIYNKPNELIKTKDFSKADKFIETNYYRNGKINSLAKYFVEEGKKVPEVFIEFDKNGDTLIYKTFDSYYARGQLKIDEIRFKNGKRYIKKEGVREFYDAYQEFPSVYADSEKIISSKKYNNSVVSSSENNSIKDKRRISFGEARGILINSKDPNASNKLFGKPDETWQKNLITYYLYYYSATVNGELVHVKVTYDNSSRVGMLGHVEDVTYHKLGSKIPVGRFNSVKSPK